MLLAKDIQSSILEAAIEGKLTERSLKDTPVNITLCEVTAIRSFLVKQKKIKKVTAKDDDVPSFNIPSEWEWVRLSDIGELSRGKSKHRPRNDAILYKNGTFPLIQTGDVAFAKKYITQFNTCYNEKGLAQSRLWKKGTLCITIAANIGDVAILTFDACFPDSILGFVPFSEDISIEYVYYMLIAYKQRLNIKASKVAQSNLCLDKINTMFFPFPPIEEQQRIVDRVNELLAKVDEFEKIEQQLMTLKTNFPGDMRAAILQAAMQGKLTEQLETDSSIEELLEHIDTDRSALIATNVYKPDKKLKPLSDEVLPFDVPENWTWIRLGYCSTYGQTKTKATQEDIQSDVWSLDLEDIEKVSGKVTTKVRAKDRPINGDKIRFNKGNILYSKLRPYLLKILIADEDGICSPELIPFDVLGGINPRYILWVLRSPHIDYAINALTYGVKMPRVGTETMINLLIPLPPIEEQQRIVDRLDKLLPLCEELVSM